MAKKTLKEKLMALITKKQEESHYTLTSIGRVRLHDLTDSEIAKKILIRSDVFRTPSFVKKALGRFIGKALILDEGDSWKHVHKMVADVFSGKNVQKDIAPIVINETNKMVDRWLESNGATLDIEHEMRSITARVVIQTVFGEGVVTEQEIDAMIDAATVSLESSREPSELAIALRAVGIRSDHIDPMKKEHKEALVQMNTVLDGVIKRYRESGQETNTVFDRLLRGTDIETGERFTDEQIRHQLIMFVVAGHETTSMALTFAIHELLKHPEEVEKMQSLMDPIVDGETVSPEDYQQLGYIKNVFLESLRLYPTAYQIAREVLEATKIEHRAKKDMIFGGKGFKKGDLVHEIDFKKGDLVFIETLEMQHDSDYWENPEVFDPDRFEGVKNPAGYLPFGHGKRVCLGRVMSETEGTLTLAQIFKRVNLERVGDAPQGLDKEFTLRFRDGVLQAKATPRR